MEEVVEAGVEVEVVSEKEVEEEAKVEEVEMCALVGRCSSCSAPGCFMSRLDKGAETQRRRQESRGGWGGRLEHVRGSRGRWGKLVVPLKERERQEAMGRGRGGVFEESSVFVDETQWWIKGGGGGVQGETARGVKGMQGKRGDGSVKWDGGGAPAPSLVPLGRDQEGGEGGGRGRDRRGGRERPVLRCARHRLVCVCVYCVREREREGERER